MSTLLLLLRPSEVDDGRFFYDSFRVCFGNSHTYQIAPTPKATIVAAASIHEDREMLNIPSKRQIQSKAAIHSFRETCTDLQRVAEPISGSLADP